MNLIYIIELLSRNLGRRLTMFIKLIKRPFQYKKISLQTLQADSQTQAKGAQNISATLKRIWDYLAKEKVKLLIVVCMVIISAVLSLLGPYMVGMAIDDYIAQKQLTGLGLLLIILVVVYLLNSLAIFLQNFLMIDVAQNTVYTLRKDLFHHFHRLPISFFDKHQHGELMSRITNDID